MHWSSMCVLEKKGTASPILKIICIYAGSEHLPYFLQHWPSIWVVLDYLEFPRWLPCFFRSNKVLVKYIAWTILKDFFWHVYLTTFQLFVEQGKNIGDIVIMVCISCNMCIVLNIMCVLCLLQYLVLITVIFVCMEFYIVVILTAKFYCIYIIICVDLNICVSCSVLLSRLELC